MTFHVVKGLSSFSKSKGKAKHRNADAAKKSRQASEDWTELKRKWGCFDTSKTVRKELTNYSLQPPPGRSTTSHIPSRDTGGGSTALKPVQKYTGTEMIGIAQMAKSNAVPVFSKESAIDIARMRRSQD